MMRNIFVTGLLFGASLVNAHIVEQEDAQKNENKEETQHDRLRAQLLRGLVEPEQDLDEDEQRELAPHHYHFSGLSHLSHYGARLYMYQMDSTLR